MTTTRLVAWVEPDGRTHYRDPHGQIGHHKAGPNCHCQEKDDDR